MIGHTRDRFSFHNPKRYGRGLPPGTYFGRVNHKRRPRRSGTRAERMARRQAWQNGAANSA